MKSDPKSHYRNPLWQRMRLAIFERDGWRCCSCGRADQNLQVHHLFYLRGRKPWEYPQDALQTLCDECHEERQELTDKILQAIAMCIRDVPSLRLVKVAQNIFAEAMTRI